tara:strand:- start:334 stop:678 length:345 start_codon:yes stop_codon:yes gene_type:complete
MKTKKFIKKVSRYLVLSKEFEQDADDLFEDEAVEAVKGYNGNNGTVMITPSSGFYSDSTLTGIINIEEVKAKTRSEVILSKAEAEASRSDRYDEYKKLQIELEKYLEALEEVNK